MDESSAAIHRYENDCDLRVIQVPLGHAGVRTGTTAIQMSEIEVGSPAVSSPLSMLWALEKSIEAEYQIISAIIPFSGQAFDLLTSSNRWKKAAPRGLYAPTRREQPLNDAALELVFVLLWIVSFPSNLINPSR
ncbi:MAG: hypothetical protein WAK31_14775 [Chthoniobacterales bacterium]